MKFDILVPSCPKDYVKLPFVVKSIVENVVGFENIYIITPEKIKVKSQYPIITYTDLEVLPNVNPFRWKFRPNWIYQQFIKLFQNITKNEYFLTVDSDIIFNRKINFFENDKPIWYMGYDQNEAPYYKFQQIMLGYGRVYNHTFIADMNFMNKDIVSEMLAKNSYTKESFIEKSYEIVDVTCHPSECDIYGNYVAKYHPDMYLFKELKQDVHGKRFGDSRQVVWTKEEIERIIEEKKKQDIDVHTMHSWCLHFENRWGI